MDGTVSMPGASPPRNEVGLLVVHLPTADISIHTVRLTAKGEPSLTGPVGDPRRPLAEGGSIVLRAGDIHPADPEVYRPDEAREAALLAEAVLLAEQQGWRVIRGHEAVSLLASAVPPDPFHGHGPALRVDTGELAWQPLSAPDKAPRHSRAAFVTREVTA